MKQRELKIYSDDAESAGQAVDELSETTIALGRKLGILMAYMFDDDDRNKIMELVEKMELKQLFEFTNSLDDAYRRGLENSAGDSGVYFKQQYEEIYKKYYELQDKLTSTTLAELSVLEKEVDSL